jgi:hypothetical protein
MVKKNETKHDYACYTGLHSTIRCKQAGIFKTAHSFIEPGPAYSYLHYLTLFYVMNMSLTEG